MVSLIALCVLLIIFAQGCLSQAVIDEQLASYPQFMRDNIGKIKYEPFSPFSLLLISGMTSKSTGDIWLFALADKNTLLHEAAHSVYFKAKDTKQFYNDFSQMSTPIPHNNLVLFAVPMAGLLPCKDFRNLYASTNIYEDMAECFVAGVNGETGSEKFNKKVDRVLEFYIKGK